MTYHIVDITFNAIEVRTQSGALSHEGPMYILAKMKFVP